MTKKHVLIGTSLAAALGCAQLMFGRPVVNIGSRHGQLREAQSFIVQAYDSISNAQVNNNSQLGGHAAKAKQLLEQADAELRQAATTANTEHR